LKISKFLFGLTITIAEVGTSQFHCGFICVPLSATNSL
jgi:hypothetical protein